MNGKQKISILAPPALVAVMYTVFRLLANALEDNWRLAWYLGLIIYWLACCGLFPWLMIGPERIKRRIFLLVLFPVLMAGLYRFVPNMNYDKPGFWIFLMLLSTNFGNGFFEEVLWRAVYMDLFPGNLFSRIVWPCSWFALWHYVPGSISPSGNVLGLMIGSGLMGFYLAFLANKTGKIWWTILAHTIGGFIMIV